MELLQKFLDLKYIIMLNKLQFIKKEVKKYGYVSKKKNESRK